jgi:hypothetical protein
LITAYCSSPRKLQLMFIPQGTRQNVADGTQFRFSFKQKQASP